MATLQKIPPLIDRFAMDDKLNMLADGVNNLVEGFGPYLDKAIDAAQAANEAAENANTAATNAGEAVAGIDDKVQEAVNERVLAKQYGPASVISASGVCENVPVAGMKVFGETRQNLWVNPATRTQNGISLTSNADGSLTLNGTASEASYFYVDVYCLKPGARYTLSLDRSVNASISVQSYGDSGYIANSVFVAAGSTSASGTVSQDATKFRLMVQMNTGITVDNVTVRVMLNEGSSAQPWCPPGLSSVSELGVVTAGKNLLDLGDAEWTSGMWIDSSIGGQSSSSEYSAILDYLDFSVPGGTTVVVNKDIAGYNPGIAFYGAGYRFLGGMKKSGVVPEGTRYVRVTANAGDEDDYQIELGSTATAYEPPTVTTTPQDLSGHELRSLPDGTRDVLSVDGSGAVSVEENAMLVSLDGSSDEVWSYDTGGVYAYITISGRKPVAQTEENTFANLPIYATSDEFLASDTACLYISPTYFNVRSPEGFKSVQDAREWLSDNPVTAVLMRDKPAITQLDPITPPTVPAPDASLWAASDVPCDIEASLWEPFAEEGGMQQKALIEVAKSLLNLANNAEVEVLNAQFADTGVAIRIGNLYAVIAQGPERTDNNLEIVTTKEIPLKSTDPQICILKTRVGQGNGEFIHETINIPGQDPSFYIRTGSTPNGYELLFVAYID